MLAVYFRNINTRIVLEHVRKPHHIRKFIHEIQFLQHNVTEIFNETDQVEITDLRVLNLDLAGKDLKQFNIQSDFVADIRALHFQYHALPGVKFCYVNLCNRCRGDVFFVEFGKNTVDRSSNLVLNDLDCNVIRHWPRRGL
ncbi:hypothetical protein D3C86_1230560 [compost metagenome]